MIFVTGDAHGDFRKLNAEAFPQQKTMTREDYVIICGDFGGVWDDSQEEHEVLDWLQQRPFTILWVDGNHENHDLLETFPVERWHGGKVHRIRPNVLHLMRGQLYEIGGFTFFTMGGASSHDIQDGILDPADPFFEEDYDRMSRENRMFRVLGLSWWPKEMPSQQEYDTALETLEKADWKVDYVISHCAPSPIVKSLGSWHETDKLTDFFQTVSEKLDFRYWFFGHYHGDGFLSIDERYALMYREVMRIR